MSMLGDTLDEIINTPPPSQALVHLLEILNDITTESPPPAQPAQPVQPAQPPQPAPEVPLYFLGEQIGVRPAGPCQVQ